MKKPQGKSSTAKADKARRAKRQKYTDALKSLQMEKRDWAVDPKTGRRLTPLEVGLTRIAASKEKPMPKAETYAANKRKKQKKKK